MQLCHRETLDAGSPREKGPERPVSSSEKLRFWYSCDTEYALGRSCSPDYKDGFPIQSEDSSKTADCPGPAGADGCRGRFVFILGEQMGGHQLQHPDLQVRVHPAPHG